MLPELGYSSVVRQYMDQKCMVDVKIHSLKILRDLFLKLQQRKTNRLDRGINMC